VELNGHWNPPSLEAVFGWTTSSHPDLANYELRVTTGSTYDPTVASVVVFT